MKEREKEALKRFLKSFEKLDEFKKERLFGIAEGLELAQKNKAHTKAGFKH